jgi:hypothetical protein
LSKWMVEWPTFGKGYANIIFKKITIFKIQTTHLHNHENNQQKSLKNVKKRWMFMLVRTKRIMVEYQSRWQSTLHLTLLWKLKWIYCLTLRFFMGSIACCPY